MSKKLITLLCILSTLISSCFLKKDVDPYDGLNENIQNIVPQAVLDSLESRGFVINRGDTPPILDYAIKVAPNVMVSPYGPEDSYEIGKRFTDGFIKFYGQTPEGNITYAYKTSGNSSGNGNGSFISGNGNDFTIFSQLKGQNNDVDFTSLDVISGTYTETGIKNYYKAFIITQKNEAAENGVIIPLNTGRIVKDEDGFSEVINDFDVLAKSRINSSIDEHEKDAMEN